MIVNVSVDFEGPFLHTDQYERALGTFLRDAVKVVGDQARADVMQISDQSFKHPTPYYETQIIAQAQGADVIVHDRGIIYGPWLEGVSARNETTRFKGYHMFRRATYRLKRELPRVMRPTLHRFLNSIGGREG